MTDQTDIDALRTAPVAAQRHFIGGERVVPERSMASISPLDGRVLAEIGDATDAEVARACAAARAAFEDGRWSRQPPALRKRVLLRLAELIEREATVLAVLGVRDNGTEIAMALRAEPGSAAQTFRWYAEAIDKLYGEVAPTAESVLALVTREPVGVVGAIVPWNFPLMIGAWKLAPALAAGNSVVLKPAESASLTLLRLAELGAEAGLPAGVLNVVTGRGATAGAALALSADVDALLFTGSGPVGRRLLDCSARSNLKRVWLELGGKSPAVVFADAGDLDRVAAMVANGIFRNAGQVCIACSRLLVEASIHDAFVAKLAAVAARLRVGDPLLLATEVGAVHSAAQLDKNLGYVAGARAAGAEVVTGGTRLHAATGGFYMAPTVLAGVDPASPVAREEVFGPVIAVTPFRDEDEAVRLANGTGYGLAAGVFTRDLSRAHRMVRRIRAGVVHVNTWGGADVGVPLGGMRQSGNGADKSLHAFAKVTDLKTAWIAL
jgi:gamma-glutamyl-gamma-aminobutyraldehyde dehydrogenase